MTIQTASTTSITATQTSSASVRPKAKIFDASAMANTFVSVPAPQVVSKINKRQGIKRMSGTNTTKKKTAPAKAAPNVSKSKSKSKGKGNGKATQTTPLYDEVGPDDWISFDGEFQDAQYPGFGWGPELAWVAVVGPGGRVLYNTFVRHEDEDPHGTLRKLPKGFGVTWNDLRYRNGAVNAREVEKNLKKFFQGRTVVVHAGRQDKLAFKYEKAFETAAEVIDTQKLFAYLQYDGQPKLSLAAKIVLNKDIQGGDHSPVEDAQTAGELFEVHLEKKKKALEAKGANNDERESEM